MSIFGKVTRSQALAIVNYLSTHTTKVDAVRISVQVGGTSFYDEVHACSLKFDCVRNNFKEKLNIVAKDDMLQIMISQNDDGTLYDFYNFRNFI